MTRGLLSPWGPLSPLRPVGHLVKTVSLRHLDSTGLRCNGFGHFGAEFVDGTPQQWVNQGKQGKPGDPDIQWENHSIVG